MQPNSLAQHSRFGDYYLLVSAWDPFISFCKQVPIPPWRWQVTQVEPIRFPHRLVTVGDPGRSHDPNKAIRCSLEFILLNRESFSFQVFRLEINNPRLIDGCVPHHMGKLCPCSETSLILGSVSLEPSRLLPTPRLWHASPLPFHLSGWVSVVAENLDSQDGLGALSLGLTLSPPGLSAVTALEDSRSRLAPCSPHLHGPAQSDVSRWNCLVRRLNIHSFFFLSLFLFLYKLFVFLNMRKRQQVEIEIHCSFPTTWMRLGTWRMHNERFVEETDVFILEMGENKIVVKDRASEAITLLDLELTKARHQLIIANAPASACGA